MKILFASYGFTKNNYHLMPWRIIFENYKYLTKKGHRVVIISIGESKKSFHSFKLSTNIFKIRKNSKYFETDLKRIILGFKPDIIFWPISWREPNYRLSLLKKIGIPVVAYFPGGIYHASSILYSMTQLTFHKCKPYLFECIAQNLRNIRHFEQYNIKSIIALTRFTASKAISNGWPKEKTEVIPPGKDLFIKSQFNVKLPTMAKNWLNGRPFYLFMGPPDKIRGPFELLNSFNLLANYNPEICLVCLFRSDAPLDKHLLKRHINSLKNSNRIFSIWESVDRQTIDSFIYHCIAVVLPFLIVPSEIPLAIYDAMKFGKPVITSQYCGTGQFVQPFGITVPVGSLRALSDAMLLFLSDKKLYRSKCNESRVLYSKLPDWKIMAHSWLQVAKNTLDHLYKEL